MQNSNNHNMMAHTTWNCKYHVVFAPKYRRKFFFGEKKAEIGKILRTLCDWKGINILEAEICPDHVHMLLEIPPKVSVSSFIGYIVAYIQNQLKEDKYGDQLTMFGKM